MPHQETRASAHPGAERARMFVEQDSSFVGNARQSLPPLGISHRGELKAGLVRQGCRGKLRMPLGDGGDRAVENAGGEVVELDLDILLEGDVTPVRLIDQQHGLKTIIRRHAAQLSTRFDQRTQVVQFERRPGPGVQLRSHGRPLFWLLDTGGA